MGRVRARAVRVLFKNRRKTVVDENEMAQWIKALAPNVIMIPKTTRCK